jgi:hypothetical protein
VDEGLGEIPAQLALLDVELLGKKAGTPRRGPGTLKPANPLKGAPRAEAGEGHPEVADEEGTFGLFEAKTLMSESVDAVVLGELFDHRSTGRHATRVLGGDGAAYLGQQ